MDNISTMASKNSLDCGMPMFADHLMRGNGSDSRFSCKTCGGLGGMDATYSIYPYVNHTPRCTAKCNPALTVWGYSKVERCHIKCEYVFSQPPPK